MTNWQNILAAAELLDQFADRLPSDKDVLCLLVEAMRSRDDSLVADAIRVARSKLGEVNDA